MKHKEQPCSIHWVASCEREFKNLGYSGNILIFPFQKPYQNAMMWRGPETPCERNCFGRSVLDYGHTCFLGSLLWGACGRTEDVKLRVKWKARVKPAWDLSIVDLFVSQPGLVLGIASPQVQHLALGFVQCHELPMAQFSGLSQSLWMTSWFSNVSAALYENREPHCCLWLCELWLLSPGWLHIICCQ